MSTIKISQLPAKGANLEATDLVEISEFNGSGYVSKSITGQEIIDAASGSGVTDVTATAPLSSSGGSTPDISIPQASTIDDGYLSSIDFSTFNAKQDELISGINIKTLNGASLLGSGGLSVQPTLVSGTNIKTINSTSILGSGDIAISSGVTDVTGTSPIVSTGGTTPDISISQSGAATDGYLSTGDWNAFNNKQDALISGVSIKTLNGASLLGSGGLSVQSTLVSGTNIKTINGNSVLGSGDLTISGGGGGAGLYALLPPLSGTIVNNRIFGSASAGTAYGNAVIYLMPFIPANTFTASDVSILVGTLQVGAQGRILIYSNGTSGIYVNKPYNKLFESADLSFASTGQKTASISLTFTAGTTYWIGFHNSFTVTSASITSLGTSNAAYIIPISASATANTSMFNSAYAYGSAPATMTTAATPGSAAYPYMAFTVA